MNGLYILYALQLMIILYNIWKFKSIKKNLYYTNGRDITSINKSEISNIPIDDIGEWGQYINLE